MSLNRSVLVLTEVPLRHRSCIRFLTFISDSPPPAVSAYPVRLCVVNIRTERVHWVTVGYIPMVLHKYETSARERSSATKAELLQRSLYLIFGRCMDASHTGCTLTLANGTTMTVSPRLLLFCCDYQEERNLLSLKQHGSNYDCTPCMADSETFAGRQGVNQRRRDVTSTVTAQLDGARMRQEHGNTAAVKKIENTHGIHCRVPALAGWAGLGSGCKHLYQVTGFDRLHVRGAPLPSSARAPVHFVLSLFHCYRVLKSTATDERAHGLPPLSLSPCCSSHHDLVGPL